jgi:sporulation protein YlmC with PRC-barrel domain
MSQSSLVDREIHVERLLGRRVHDSEGRMIGRLEEIVADVVDNETVVTEYHVGPAAFWERVGGFAVQLPFLGWLPVERRIYRIPWNVMDVSDPDRPRANAPVTSLSRTERFLK